MSSNNNLTAAKAAKNDEFYTPLSDIEAELKYYREHFKGKVVYCNCDNPEWSNFWNFFHLNFNFLGLKRLITTHFEFSTPTYRKDYSGGSDEDLNAGTVTPLKGNGDFRSPECIEILKESDIVVTNPPFSLFREYMAQLVEYGKKLIIIGSINGLKYKEIFPLIKDGKLWVGYHCGNKNFTTPIEGEVKAVRAFWYTNLEIKKRTEFIDLIESYSPEKYPKFANYDAINVEKTLDIPKDYEGVMGVPISFLDKFCPRQFEIIGLVNNPKLMVDGKLKPIYSRILIQRKKDEH